jgi:hypothetical protein
MRLSLLVGAGLFLLVGCRSEVETAPEATPRTAEQVLEEFKQRGGKIEVDEKAPGKPVVGLDLKHMPLSDADMAELHWFPEVRTLTLDLDVFVGDQTGRVLSPDALKYLADLPKVRSLSLGGRNVGDKDMVYVQGMRLLERLSLPQTAVSNEGLKCIQGLTNLRYLDLSEANISDAGPVALKDLKKLETLILSRTNIGDAGLEHLNGFSNLRLLDLSGLEKITGRKLGQLVGLSKLETLVLSNCENLKSVDQLTGLEGLRRLELKTSGMRNRSLESLKGLTRLQMLDLASCRLTDEGLALLKPLGGLETLDLRSNMITNAGLENLKGLDNLQDLKLGGNQKIDINSIFALKQLPKLRKLQLEGTGVGEQQLRQFKEELPDVTVSLK